MNPTEALRAASAGPDEAGSGPDDPRVLAAVEEYLAALEAGRAPARAEFLSRHAAIAARLADYLDGLELIHRAGSAAGPASGGAAPADDLAGAEPLGDFLLVREVGRGGMGVVYEAEQRSLGRRVALKVLPFAATMDPRQLQRFHNEARAAASLDHPHIVHVHAVGCERGVHYYAMQFIEGQTLAALIADLRRRSDRPAPTEEHPTTPHVAGPLAPAAPSAETAPRAAASTERAPRGRDHFRRVAELGIQAAEALDHAHALGVVHRDIKPANLLVDGRGGLWVTDFGLAHVQSDARLTLTGDLVGTLRYMSPEQALAKRGVVDHRADVYSLGATLYELLALEPAFGGADREELLRQIAFEEPKPPRRLNKAIPAELETIVLKALEKNPAERYATAQELADDLRRWLQDRPIQARRPSWARVAAKWTRRHRPVVGSVLAALVVGLAATAWQAVRATVAEQEARSALGQLEQEQDKTTAALKEARRAGQQTLEALRALTDEVLERHMARQTQLTEPDRVFLRQVLRHYEGFAATKGDGPENRAIRAEGFYRVGRIRAGLGERQDARSAYERAIALQKQLAADFPTVPGYRDSLGDSHNSLGVLLADLGKPAEAEAEFRQALVLRKQLAAEFPTMASYRWVLAGTRNNLGNLWAGLGKSAEAEAEFRQALALQEQLAAGFPTVPHYRHSLANSHNGLGNLLKEVGKRAEAEAEYRKAIAVRKRLVADFPTVPDYRYNLAGSHHNLGQLLAGLGRPVEAEAECRQALALQRQLAADFPTVPNYRDYLARHHNNLGAVLWRLGKRAEAEAEFRQALTLRKQLAADFPNVPGYRRNLAESHHNLGGALAGLGKWTKVEAEYRHALALYRQLAADFPTVPGYRQNLANSHNSLGALLSDLRKPAEAGPEYRQALALYKQLAADFPNVPDYQIGLAGNYCNLGNLVRDRPADALRWYDQAIQVLAAALAREPRLATARRYLRNNHICRAEALMKLDRLADAARDWDRALELDDSPKRARVRLVRAQSLARIEPAKAVAEAEALLQGDPLPPYLLYDAACVYALASGRVRDAAVTDKYAARALALLRQVQQTGWFDDPAQVEHLKQDTDLEPLRSRADFQKLLAALQAPKQ
jgi:serine/threonine protein kinase/Tfp pilus assembly protein PilF